MIGSSHGGREGHSINTVGNYRAKAQRERSHRRSVEAGRNLDEEIKSRCRKEPGGSSVQFRSGRPNLV